MTDQRKLFPHVLTQEEITNLAQVKLSVSDACRIFTRNTILLRGVHKEVSVTTHIGCPHCLPADERYARSCSDCEWAKLGPILQDSTSFPLKSAFCLHQTFGGVKAHEIPYLEYSATAEVYQVPHTSHDPSKVECLLLGHIEWASRFILYGSDLRSFEEGVVQREKEQKEKEEKEAKELKSQEHSLNSLIAAFPVGSFVLLHDEPSEAGSMLAKVKKQVDTHLVFLFSSGHVGPVSRIGTKRPFCTKCLTGHFTNEDCQASRLFPLWESERTQHYLKRIAVELLHLSHLETKTNG